MKLIVLLLMFSLIIHHSLRAQENNAKKQTDTSAYIHISYYSEWPEFPGGNAARNQFIANHLKYPEDALKAKIEGRVILGFVVEQDGSLTEFRILRPLHPSLDIEAMRVAQLMPNWKPGKDFNKLPIRSKHKMDIVFVLPENTKNPSSK